MATVHLPRSLVTLFPDPPPRHLEVEAATVGELIGLLDARWPGAGDRLLDSGPAIREHINLFVDGHRVRELATPLTTESVVHIIPAVSGGATTAATPPGHAAATARPRRRAPDPRAIGSRILRADTRAAAFRAPDLTNRTPQRVTGAALHGT